MERRTQSCFIYPPYETEGATEGSREIRSPDRGHRSRRTRRRFRWWPNPRSRFTLLNHEGVSMRTDCRKKGDLHRQEAGVTPNPTVAVVPRGGPPASTTLLPVSTGESIIQIDSEGLRNGSHTFVVRVTIGVWSHSAWWVACVEAESSFWRQKVGTSAARGRHCGWIRVVRDSCVRCRPAVHKLSVGRKRDRGSGGFPDRWLCGQ